MKLTVQMLRRKVTIVKSLKFMGPCIANVFSNVTNKMQRYTVYLVL